MTMQDKEKLLEIDSLGEESEGEEEPREKEKGYGGLPLAQAVVCILLLAALIVLKLAAPERYQAVAGWYQEELSREVELPSWSIGGEKRI